LQFFSGLTSCVATITSTTQAAAMEDLPYRLLLACEEGNVDAVQHFVEECGADVNAADNYLKIGGVTPLFVASLKGHLETVRYLISKAANVSAMTHTEDHTGYGGLTPLHAAFMEKRPRQQYYEKYAESSIIANLLLTAGANPSALAPDGTPVWMRHYCGVDATIVLINHGLNLKLRNPRNAESILHHWINLSTRGITEKERQAVVKLLIDSGADLMAQDIEGFTPILKSAEYQSFDMLDFLLANDVIDRNQKIEAMEHAGSILLLYSDPDNQEKGCDYWRKALQLREESPPITKTPLLMRIGRTVEWVTSDDLENAIKEPSTHRIQCMLTRLRVLSHASLLAVEIFFTDEGLQPHGYDYEGDVDRPEELWDQNAVTVMLAFLETIPRFHQDEPLRWPLTESVLRELFGRLRYDDPFFYVERFAASMRLIIAADPDGRATPPYCYGFFKSLAGLPETKLNEDIRNHLSRWADQKDLIPFACLDPDLNTLRLLLHLRADPNSSGLLDDGNGPLHVLAGMDETPLRSAAANLLFDYGAQPYRMNDEGETAVDIWRKENCGEEGVESAKWKNRPYWCRDTVPMLKNLSAKTIHIHRISYDKLPPLFHSFVKEH